MHHCLSLQHLVTFLLLSGGVRSQKACSKSNVNSCGDCIKSGPYCAWCKQLNFTKTGEQVAARCDTQAQLMQRGCKESDVISPQENIKVIRNVPLSPANRANQLEPVQLKPQSLQLDLRPGLPYTFDIKFKRAEGYPVDLYYLMDLSYSMEDDLKNVKALGKDLFQALKKITNKARIGFGSFVDKTVLPFTNTNKEKLNKPCPEEEQFCQAAFGYKHVLSMTNNEQVFNERVSKQFISGNLDSPEGSLDAIMQATVCKDLIGWGNSTRLLVLTTDAGFHMAGDGKLAAILEPNDELCHLDGSSMYSKSNYMDYPSVGQVATQLAKNNIQPIFAVTKNMEHVYKELSKMIPKSAVGVLSDDSSNVVNLIESSYNRLSSNVILSHERLPDGVKVFYTPQCAGGMSSAERGVCDNVKVGKEITFSVTVTAERCMDSVEFEIGPLGFRERTRVIVTTRCECECDDPLNDKNRYCNEKGQVSCGMCRCNSGFVGQKCECAVGDRDESSLRELCRLDNGTECEGRGDCVCGTCQCHSSEGGSAFHGAHCECDDDHCEKFQNKLCGGHGRCVCGKCVCEADYEGSACQCKKSNDGCQLGASVCSGRGQCECNQCKCQRGYKPPFCKICLGCPSLCQKAGNCIECLGFQTGPFSKNCSEACRHVQNVMVDTVQTEKPCRHKDTEDCWVVYDIEELDGFDQFKTQIQRERECPEPPNILAIIFGSIIGVAVIGFLILLIIKGLIYANDLKEFRKFENEKKKSKWAAGDNPIFQTATTTTQNPTFTGE